MWMAVQAVECVYPCFCFLACATLLRTALATVALARYHTAHVAHWHGLAAICDQFVSKVKQSPAAPCYQALVERKMLHH